MDRRKSFLDYCCIPIIMHEVWRGLGLMQLIVEHQSIPRQEIAMMQERVVPGEYGISFLILALKEAEIKAEIIPVHMH